MFANATTFAHVQSDELAAPRGTAVADALRRASPGDYVVPLYENSHAPGEDQLRALDELAGKISQHSGQQLLTLYGTVAGRVPHLLRVAAPASERTDDGNIAVVVPIKVEALPSPLPAADFLRLRALSETVALQFKGLAPSRPIQEVSHALIIGVRAAAATDRDDKALLRNLSLVAAQNAETAAELLTAVGRTPREGDLAFLVTRAAMPGLTSADASVACHK